MGGNWEQTAKMSNKYTSTEDPRVPANKTNDCVIQLFKCKLFRIKVYLLSDYTNLCIKNVYGHSAHKDPCVLMDTLPGDKGITELSSIEPKSPPRENKESDTRGRGDVAELVSHLRASE